MANTSPTDLSARLDKIEKLLKESTSPKKQQETKETREMAVNGAKALNSLYRSWKKPTGMFDKTIAKILETKTGRAFGKSLAEIKFTITNVWQNLSNKVSGIMRTALGKFLDDISPVIELFKSTLSLAKNVVLKPMAKIFWGLSKFLFKGLFGWIGFFRDLLKHGVESKRVKVLIEQLDLHKDLNTKLGKIISELQLSYYKRLSSSKTVDKEEKKYWSSKVKDETEKYRESEKKSKTPPKKISQKEEEAGEGGISKVKSVFSTVFGVLGTLLDFAKPVFSFIGATVILVLFKHLWNAFIKTSVGKWFKSELVDPVVSWLKDKMLTGIDFVLKTLGDSINNALHEMWMTDRAKHNETLKQQEADNQVKLANIDKEISETTDPNKLRELKEKKNKGKQEDELIKKRKLISDKWHDTSIMSFRLARESKNIFTKYSKEHKKDKDLLKLYNTPEWQDIVYRIDNKLDIDPKSVNKMYQGYLNIHQQHGVSAPSLKNSGGIFVVPGNTSINRDSQLGMVEDGSFVLKQSSSKKILKGFKQGGVTRGIRNNNPGNIEWRGGFAKAHGAVGSDGRFAIFPNMEMGIRAQHALIYGGKNYRNLTLRQMLYRYAGPNENPTLKYLQFITSKTGINPDKKIMKEFTPQERQLISSAMFKFESGYDAGTKYPNISNRYIASQGSVGQDDTRQKTGKKGSGLDSLLSALTLISDLAGALNPFSSFTTSTSPTPGELKSGGGGESSSSDTLRKAEGERKTLVRNGNGSPTNSPVMIVKEGDNNFISGLGEGTNPLNFIPGREKLVKGLNSCSA